MMVMAPRVSGQVHVASGCMAETPSDVVDLILADHRRFEQLFSDLRDTTADRVAVRAELSRLLVSHAESEERHVYPGLRAGGASTQHDITHSKREHSHGHAALLALLEVEDTAAEEFDDAVEVLFEAVTHHVNEEELTLLNDARTSISATKRKTLGRAFRTARDKAMKQNVGGIEHVRTIQDRHGLGKLGVEDLRALAAAREVSGRGGMTKQQLIQSLTD